MMRWLCRRNRHRRVYRTTAYPAHALAALVGALSAAPEEAVVVHCGRFECSRCGIGLRMAIRRVLGWEGYDESD